ncbi:TIGR04255 family protein [Caballeronia sp. SEWSISQ10-4 2]|uniref:TIGR04255 family protein n=1 Tax=Caballeronia sp. SEWSISQ10-4 2 TaxID=2937438 RepID=UPI00264BF9E3|nr:TIGR04255 family protein [Caballeronia sp. SEWSISQ10-4 2]MDN7182064.1 TIGR04255 family protein [Caballeronia sp. SEWSISQ10-4 2]
MTSDDRYPNAPITEAVIDIQVATPVTVDTLGQTHLGEEAKYPSSEKLNAATGALFFSPEMAPVATASAQPLGHLYRSPDGKQIYQARTTGYTFSRLAPYPHWAEFCSEARRLWDKYCTVAKPTAITRVAVRYVNRIDIPLPLKSFGDYLRTAPQLSPDLPEGLSGYFMHLMIPLTEIKCEAIINQTIIEPAKPDVVSIVLDIDIFRTVDLPVDEDQLWALLEQLRQAKNRVFEASITEEARRLFK